MLTLIACHKSAQLQDRKSTTVSNVRAHQLRSVVPVTDFRGAKKYVNKMKSLKEIFKEKVHFSPRFPILCNLHRRQTVTCLMPARRKTSTLYPSFLQKCVLETCLFDLNEIHLISRKNR